MPKNLPIIISELLKQEGITVAELSRRTGILDPVLRKICNGETSNPGINTLNPIAKQLKVTIGQLIGDEPLCINNTGYSPAKWQNVPLLSWDTISKFQKDSNAVTPIELIQTNAHIGEHAFALKIEEDLEHMLSGTIIIVDPNITPENKDFVVAQKKGQKDTSIKQAIVSDGEILFRSLIKELRLPPTKLKEFEIFGVIVQYQKNR